MIKNILSAGNPANEKANKIVGIATGVVIPVITALAAAFTAGQNMYNMNKKK